MESKHTFKIIKATVAGIVVKKSDPKKILLTRRAIEPFKDKWCLPGGHIEAFETAQEAVAREILEETNIRVNPTFFRYFDEIIPEIDHHNVVIVFIGIDDSDSDIDDHFQNEEVSEMKWFDIKHATQLELAFTHAKIVQEYLKAYHL
jgi:8-oxo-dGTP diphosphatase